jgi:hypothetical protein
MTYSEGKLEVTAVKHLRVLHHSQLNRVRTRQTFAYSDTKSQVDFPLRGAN